LFSTGKKNAFSTGKKNWFFYWEEKSLSEMSDSEISVFQRYTLGWHEYGASGKVA
jgi:hypothetical protein